MPKKSRNGGTVDPKWFWKWVGITNPSPGANLWRELREPSSSVIKEHTHFSGIKQCSKWWSYQEKQEEFPFQIVALPRGVAFFFLGGGIIQSSNVWVNFGWKLKLVLSWNFGVSFWRRKAKGGEISQRFVWVCSQQSLLGGGNPNIYCVSPLFGEMIQFDNFLISWDPPALVMTIQFVTPFFLNSCWKTTN